MGYALLHVKQRKAELVTLDVVKMTRLPNQSEKLKRIFEATVDLINQHKPTILAIEAPFFGKNPQSMLKLGRAQGVVIAACLHHNLQVFEYSPRKIKQSITGNGSATKEQVAAMLRTMFPIPEETKYFDATDALAVAECHFLQNRFPDQNQKFSGWESFITKNSDRIL